MTKAVYPGSFDPITNGHLDIIRRAARMFDEVVVAVLKNSSKSPMFTVDERVALIEEATKGLDNVTVDHFDGLLVDYMEKTNSRVIVKGLRAMQDFEAEFQMAAMNRKLAPDVDTCFIMTRTEYMYLSSSIVKEVTKYSSNIDDFVPPCVATAIKAKFGRD